MGFSREEYWSELPSLLQGIFPTQGLNLGLLHCRHILSPSEATRIRSLVGFRVFGNSSVKGHKVEAGLHARSWFGL